MATSNIARTAIVNLAVLGTSSIDEQGNPISFNLQDQLHDFSYTVLSDGNGNDSYKFKIELINYNDTSRNALTNAFSTSLHDDNASIVGKQDMLKAFPKLLIQWGYPDALSKIHVAQLSDIKYKFGRSKEKILIIEAVNAGDWADEFYKQTSVTSELVEMSKVGNNTIFQNKTVVSTIISILSGALSNIEGIAVELDIDASVSGVLEKEYTSIINSLTQAPTLEQQEENELTLKEKILRVMKSTITPGAAIKEIEIDKARKNANRKFQAIKRFFKILGLTAENTLKPTKNPDFPDEPEQIRQTDENLNTQYYPITKSLVGEDTGVHGGITEFIPASQLKDTSKIENLNPAFESIVKENIFLEFNRTSSPLWDSHAANVAFAHNELNPSNLIDERDITFFLNLSTVNQNAIKSGATVMEKTLMVKSVTSNGNTIGLERYAPPSIKVTPDDRIAGDNPAILKHHLRKVDYQVQKEKSELADKAVFTDAQLNKYNEDSLGAPLTYTELDNDSKFRLFYSSIKIGLHSKAKESTLVTVKNIIKNLNSLVSKPEYRIHLSEISPAFDSTHESFEDVKNRIDGVDITGKPKTTVLDNMPTTVFRFTTNSVIKSNASDRLLPIVSFPNVQSSKNSKHALISYGKSDSIVKYFDFTGDIRYLANMQAAQATRQSLTNSYEYLKTDSRIKIVDVIDILLNSTDFKDKLESKYKNNNKFIENLEMFRDQLDADDAADLPGVNFRFLEQTGFLAEYLKEQRAHRTRADEGDFPAAQKFFAALSTQIGMTQLFNAIPVEHREVSYNKFLKLEDPNNPDIVPSKSHSYQLKSETIFDKHVQELAVRSNTVISKTVETALASYFNNSLEVWEVKVKTLGIPEMDTLDEISAPRVFDFTVHDLSREAESEGRSAHWLSGLYKPIAINHKINNSVGYISEFKLLKDMGIA